MENINEYIGLIVAVGIVAIVVVLQLISFVRNRSKIKELEGVFRDVEELRLVETSITPDILRSKEKLRKFLEQIPPRDIKTGKDCTNLSLIAMPSNKSYNKRLRSIVYRTNEYLCKNAGTSAELKILKDICDNQVNMLEDEIHNSMNVPLYLGLAGTFTGIITGLFGINLKAIFDTSTTDFTGLQHLLNGIVIAMFASFLGLAFTVWNSAVEYKKAVAILDAGKEKYMDFLRRELLPLLSNSMASSLHSLRGVLGHFVDKFGRNLDAYADAAELLNDNLEKQHLVLQEINQLGLTKTANKIVAIFSQLNGSADSLSVFRDYQKGLNDTITTVSKAVAQIKTLLDKFNEFSDGLALVVSNQNKANELQSKFQDAIETHFPTGGEARDVWRKEFDLLMSEGKQVSESLSTQLTASTEYIRNFVANNNEFFDTFNKMKEVLETMVQYTQVQAECYKDLKGEVLNLRKDYKDAQIESLELHKETIKAMNTMTEAIKEIKK